MGSIRIDDQEASTHGVEVGADSKSISFDGWTFEANVGSITRDADFDDLRQQVGGARNLPEQLFGGNYIRVRHPESGFQIELNSIEALKQWHDHNLAPLQLKHANNWRQSRAASFAAHDIVNVSYDWTYTTPNRGTFHRIQEGRVSSIDESAWTNIDEAMDKTLLLQREPILFFAEVPMYESELDDNGSSQLVAKIRVMPSCWYVLQRFFLRVDNHLVRIHDLRVLCNLTSTQRNVVREELHMEASYEELTAARVGTAPAAFAQADAAAELFQAIAPTGVKSLSTTVLEV